MSLAEAIAALKAGRFVLVHDDKGRENEIDMVVAAEHIKPHHVATMRNDAGGLICLAVANEVTAKLGLVYMHDMIADMGKVNPVFSKLTEGKAAYGDKPSFSISVNHRSTYTGITDNDRALTISKMAQVCRDIDSGGVDYFAGNFRAPGHVPPVKVPLQKFVARLRSASVPPLAASTMPRLLQFSAIRPTPPPGTSALIVP